MSHSVCACIKLSARIKHGTEILQNITCFSYIRLFFFFPPTHRCSAKFCSHWSTLKKVSTFCLLPLHNEIEHWWHHTVGLASEPAVQSPGHSFSVWTSSAWEGSLLQPHCSIATAGNILLESLTMAPLSQWNAADGINELWTTVSHTFFFFFLNWGIISVSAVGFSLLRVWILPPLGKGIKKKRKKKNSNRTYLTWMGK